MKRDTITRVEYLTRVRRDARVQLGKEVARAYDSAVSDPSNPETVRCYAAFNTEIAAQYDALVASGFRFEAWQGAGQPYGGSETDSYPVLHDVIINRHLFYFKSENGTDLHGLISLEQNDRFRCVHDVLGHGAGWLSFSHAGETLAFQLHAAKLSWDAIRALATETLGQNSALNFTSPERGYVAQKAILLPEGLIVRGLDLKIDANDIDEFGRGPYVA